MKVRNGSVKGKELTSNPWLEKYSLLSIPNHEKLSARAHDCSKPCPTTIGKCDAG